MRTPQKRLINWNDEPTSRDVEKGKTQQDEQKQLHHRGDSESKFLNRIFLYEASFYKPLQPQFVERELLYGLIFHWTVGL